VDDTARVLLGLTNTSGRADTEVAQVYLGRLPGVDPRSASSPVELAPGERQRVRIHIDRRAFSYWDSDSPCWVTPTGTVQVYVGPSATDVRLVRTIRVR
jgi:beta-glucosidase